MRNAVFPIIREESGDSQQASAVTNTELQNVFSVDLEDYFMVSAFERAIRRSDWITMESRIEKNTFKLLEMLERHEVRATFFVLGWVAEHHPSLIRKIHSRGHEIASHGYYHHLIYNQNPEEFRKDVKKSKSILEDLIGEKIDGYRAPSYSIKRNSLWAYDILIEQGFKYDSSVFPIHHDRYGDPRFSRYPVMVRREGIGEILEIPMTTVRVLGQNLPVAGGGYFRIFPIKLTEWAIRRINKKEKRPAVFYIHPWEIDPDQPRIKEDFMTLLRHHVNIRKSESKLEVMLTKFRFAPFRDVFPLAPTLS